MARDMWVEKQHGPLRGIESNFVQSGNVAGQLGWSRCVPAFRRDLVSDTPSKNLLLSLRDCESWTIPLGKREGSLDAVSAFSIGNKVGFKQSFPLNLGDIYRQKKNDFFFLAVLLLFL